MPEMIVVDGNANALTYTIPGTEPITVEAISCDIDTTGVTPGTQSACDAIYRDRSGNLIARSRSSTTIPDGTQVTMTFAPWMPDTLELGNDLAGLVNTTGLCATSLPAGATVTVQGVDVAAIITEARLWVTPATDDQGSAGDSLEVFGEWAYVPGPNA